MFCFVQKKLFCSWSLKFSQMLPFYSVISRTATKTSRKMSSFVFLDLEAIDASLDARVTALEENSGGASNGLCVSSGADPGLW